MQKKRPKKARAAKRRSRKAPRRVVSPVLVVALLFSATMAAGMVIRTTQAATFQGPTNAPPQGNIPVTIWNRVSTGTQQSSAAIDIDGGGPPPAPTGIAVGSPALDLGLAAGGQNVIYAVADAAKMNVSDNLLLLQAPSGTNRLSVDKNGNIVAQGAVNAASVTLGNLIGRGPNNQFGSAATDLGVGAAGQSLATLMADFAKMNAGDQFLRAESYVGAIPTERFSVSRDGNVAVNGMSTFGDASKVLSVGQNLLYGNTDTTSAGNLVLLQQESVDRFKVDVLGATTTFGDIATTNGNLSANIGNVNAGGCFGPTFKGRTALLYTGNLNGIASPSYVAANALCVSGFGTGAHVCSSAEMMNSVKCSIAASPVRSQASNADAWIQDGPPGFTAPANDCMGWTSANSGHLGRMWKFNEPAGTLPATTVGRGYLTTCQQSIPFACCN